MRPTLKFLDDDLNVKIIDCVCSEIGKYLGMPTRARRFGMQRLPGRG